MSKYRKKPVVIEAQQLTPGMQPRIAMWCHGIPQGDGTILISTLEGASGIMTALPNDWIICGVKGEFYPCKPDIFEATYEAVENSRD
jgi:hypothetical protein